MHKNVRTDATVDVLVDRSSRFPLQTCKLKLDQSKQGKEYSIRLDCPVEYPQRLTTLDCETLVLGIGI